MPVLYQAHDRYKQWIDWLGRLNKSKKPILLSQANTSGRGILIHLELQSSGTLQEIYVGIPLLYLCILDHGQIRGQRIMPKT